jgi:hypothetical protein
MGMADYTAILSKTEAVLVEVPVDLHPLPDQAGIVL